MYMYLQLSNQRLAYRKHLHATYCYYFHVPTIDILVGLLRLRKCSEDTFRPELKGGVSVVRELHVYGSVVPVSARDPSKFQHQVSWVCCKCH